MRALIGVFAAAFLLQAQPSAAVEPLPGPLVSTAWLADNLGDDEVLVVDIRPAAAFGAAHIPGSLQSDYPGRWRTERDGVPWVVPAMADLEAYLSSIGVGAETSVVVVPAGTDSTELGGATWIYWVLKYVGHDAVAILDGGWNAWASDGGPTEAGAADPPTSRSFAARPRDDYLATTDHVLARLHTDAVIVDARPPAQYAGDTRSNLVVRSGHIPGAISLDNALFYDAAANRLRPLDELLAQLPPELADQSAEVIAYCNTGHWSSINWFVLHELLGFTDVRLYEGSMAAWSRDPDLPIVVGLDPG
jgi:thiosulfate/3-mercaptopyruvate sulfurtransferase